MEDKKRLFAEPYIHYASFDKGYNKAIKDFEERAKEHIKKRLYETGLNNVCVMCDAGDVYKDLAEFRIDNWIYEIVKQLKAGVTV